LLSRQAAQIKYIFASLVVVFTRNSNAQAGWVNFIFMKETDFPIAFESFVTPKGVWFHTLGLMVWKQVYSEFNISLYRTLFLCVFVQKTLRSISSKEI